MLFTKFELFANGFDLRTEPKLWLETLGQFLRLIHHLRFI